MTLEEKRNKYKNICDKLGFAPHLYHKTAISRKDDIPNPYLMLTEEEREFLLSESWEKLK